MRRQQTESVRATQLCNNIYTKPVKEHNQRQAYANDIDKHRESRRQKEWKVQKAKSLSNPLVSGNRSKNGGILQSEQLAGVRCFQEMNFADIRCMATI